MLWSVSKINGISYLHEKPIGRLPILGVKPSVEAGRWPAKAFKGEVIPFTANVFREGHDALGVELLLSDPSGKQQVHRMAPGSLGSDLWHIKVQLAEQGLWKFQIRAFADDYETGTTTQVSSLRLASMKS